MRACEERFVCSPCQRSYQMGLVWARADSLTLAVALISFLPAFTCIVGGFLQFLPNDASGLVGFHGCFVSRLSHFACNRIGIVVTIFSAFVRTACCRRYESS